MPPPPTRREGEEEEEHRATTEVLITQPNEIALKSAVNGRDGGAEFDTREAGERRKKSVSQPHELLETRAERKARRISHMIVYFTTFIMSIGFSIILTGVWPYMQQLDPSVSKQSLGWVIAANPLGQMLASPLLGYWANKAGSNRSAFLLTVFIFALGNGLYAILSVFGSSAKAVMIFSRFLVGVSSANIAIIRTYISASTFLEERTTAVIFTSAAQGLGFIFGPAIQTALVVAFSREDANSSSNSTTSTMMDEVEVKGGIEFNMYAATGWIGVVLGLINFMLFLPCVYKEHTIATKEARLQMRINQNAVVKLPKPDYVGLINMLCSFFIFLMIYVLLETLLVPMCIDMYAWTDEMAVTIIGIGLSIAGAMSIINFMMAGFLTKRFDERKVLIICGILPMALSMLLHLPMGSTYPKIKNCTTPAPPITTFATELDSLPFNFTDEEVKLPSTSTSNELTTINTLLYDDEEEEITTTSYLADIYDPAATTTLRRRRRHALRESTCNDLGCPPEQEWCFYTPIIEKSQLIVAESVAIIGYPISFTLCSSLFSKILGPKPQGVWMGILTSTGSLSRVTGPIIVTYMYTDLGTRWTFGILFMILLCTLVSNIVLYRRLVPMQVVRGP